MSIEQSVTHPGTGLRVGLLVETEPQLRLLQQWLLSGGHQLSVSLLAEDFDLMSLPPPAVDVWVVHVPDEQDRFGEMDAWLQEQDAALVIVDLEDTGADALALWRRRLLDKLARVPGSLNLARHPEGAASRVWVLGASTGGLEAVRAFFEALPASLDVGFLYVQHIASRHQPVLVDMVNRCSQYPVCEVAQGTVLPANRTAILDAEHCVSLAEDGTFMLTPGPWRGPYSPSVDQVFAQVARHWGHRCGVIVFSGMAEDGAAGARLVHRQGGQVWAQAPASCVVSSMPDAAVATGVVQVVDTPAGLAGRLASWLRKTDIRGGCTPCPPVQPIL